jgi:micrococcal nuclease
MAAPILAALSLFLLGPGPAVAASGPDVASGPTRRLPARISRVFDGESFQVGHGLRGALIGVAAPSLSARGGRESRDFLRNLLKGKTVKFEVDEKLVDSHGQARYYVYMGDGTMVNTLVLLRGYARAVIKHPNVRYRKKLLKAEKFARSYKRGIWGDDFPDPNAVEDENDPFPDRAPQLFPYLRRR